MRLFRKKDKALPPPQSGQSSSQALYSTSGNYGLRVLYEPTNATLDVVFVHGITGNRETTWATKSKVLWPRDLLPQDLPLARVITFGYDADVVRAIDIASSSTIRDHGKGLATELARKRLFDGCQDRPLIFVAHSLGGLVCEQALLISHNAPSALLTALLPSTAGLVFLGTPHAGSSHADWASILTRLSSFVRPTNRALLSVLRPGSEMLAALQQDFHGMLAARTARGESVPRLFCFFEELELAHGVGKVVPEQSAVLYGYPSQGVRADHVGMVRFGERDEQGYVNVSGQLRVWAMEIEEGRRLEESAGALVTTNTDLSTGTRAGAGVQAGAPGTTGSSDDAGVHDDRRRRGQAESMPATYPGNLAPSQVWSGTVNAAGGTVIHGNLTSSGDINIGSSRR